MNGDRDRGGIAYSFQEIQFQCFNLSISDECSLSERIGAADTEVVVALRGEGGGDSAPAERVPGADLSHQWRRAGGVLGQAGHFWGGEARQDQM